MAAVARLPAAEASAARRAMTLAREAATAADAKDNATYLAKMEEAAALRPDFPRILVNLAAAQVANERPDDAIATLTRLAALGMNSPVEKEEAFAPLRGRKDFDEVVKKLAANLYARGDGEIAFTLSEVTGLIEGIAWREKTGGFYFGDVNGRAVWTKNKDGTLKRFTPATDDLLGVFGLAVDEERGALWAATSAVPAMHGFTPEMDGTAALAEIDLDSGALRRVVPVVRKAGDRQSHVLGDLALAPDGTVLVTDSGGPTVWRLAPGANALEAAVESEEFLSLQGIVVLPGGGLVVSDYASGLLRVDPESHAVRELAPPANTTLIGIDGLALAPNGDILAIQNGLRPNRVLRIAFDSGYENVASVTVLESAHLTMAAPSLGCVAGDGNFYFIGNAGWTRFENTNGEPSSPRSVPIFKTRIAAEPAKKKS
ncbi:MAG TPA: hypothetical protein VHD62_02830 [Opitutaceae bacterium]|nr:hypothetical protein [Opitutaceae bacterium]